MKRLQLLLYHVKNASTTGFPIRSPFFFDAESRFDREAGLFFEYDRRYLGNLLEIIVTRSVFFKAVLHGLIAAAIPFFIAILVETRARPNPDLSEKVDRLPEAVLLLSNILFLTIPVDVWQDIYGRIAGFSIFGFSVFFLGAFLLLVSRIVLDEVPSFPWLTGLGFFLFGICIQLVLENVTLYIILSIFSF